MITYLKTNAGKKAEEMSIGFAYKINEQKCFIPCYHDRKAARVHGFDVFKNGNLEHNAFFYGFNTQYEECVIKGIDLVLAF